jgi:hypothetical protein
MKYIFTRSLVLLLFVFASATLQAQAPGNVGIGTINPDSTAILDLVSTKMGFLAPRMTTADRDAIANPAHGLTIFNTQDSTIQYWNGVCWLPVYQENCNDCYFNATLSAQGDTLDRVVSDSVSVTLTLNQTSGNPQNIAVNILSQLPQGVTYTITPNPQFGSGAVIITFRATPFAQSGTYPIVIQSLCGPNIVNQVFSLYIEPCYILNVINSSQNYNMAADLYSTYQNVPTNQPVCVTAIVNTGVTLQSGSTGLPTFTTGNIPAGSLVAIINNGNILGHGGDGGTANDPTANPPLTGAGFDGGDAISLTLPTTVINNFNIWGGGGGGNAMAFRIGVQLGPVFLGALIGGGGGGGAGAGLGGTTQNIIGLSFYSPGTNATAGQFGVPGIGGILNFPIPITLGPVTVTLNPYVLGGDGGAYGFPGNQGNFALNVSASVTINIPFIGPVTVPIVNNLNIPIPVPIPTPGNAGFAIRRNGNNCNIPDNNYNTSFLKGPVGN